MVDHTAVLHSAIVMSRYLASMRPWVEALPCIPPSAQHLPIFTHDTRADGDPALSRAEDGFLQSDFVAVVFC